MVIVMMVHFSIKLINEKLSGTLSVVSLGKAIVQWCCKSKEVIYHLAGTSQ